VISTYGGNVQNISNNAAFFDISPSWRPSESPTITSAFAEIRIGNWKTFKATRDFPGPTCDKTGTDGPDHLTGTSASEHICGEGGNDTIDGGGGNDILTGGPGADKLYGDSGSDILVGGTGQDRLFGNGGKDEFASRDHHHDLIMGGPGLDRARTDGRKIDPAKSVEGPLAR
jgi:Ca2+-binding RTX toxin-like protein